MCRKITCACGKATWVGCGQHVASALAGVADADRCEAVRAGKPPIAVSQVRDPCPAAASAAAAAAAAAAPPASKA
jgi:hypothetical protein